MSEVYGVCSANMELKSFNHKSGEDREGRQAALFMFSLCGLSGTLCIRISHGRGSADPQYHQGKEELGGHLQMWITMGI